LQQRQPGPVVGKKGAAKAAMMAELAAVARAEAPKERWWQTAAAVSTAAAITAANNPFHKPKPGGPPAAVPPHPAAARTVNSEMHTSGRPGMAAPPQQPQYQPQRVPVADPPRQQRVPGPDMPPAAAVPNARAVRVLPVPMPAAAIVTSPTGGSLCWADDEDDDEYAAPAPAPVQPLRNHLHPQLPTAATTSEHMRGGSVNPVGGYSGSEAPPSAATYGSSNGGKGGLHNVHVLPPPPQPVPQPPGYPMAPVVQRPAPWAAAPTAGGGRGGGGGGASIATAGAYAVPVRGGGSGSGNGGEDDELEELMQLCAT
jgi:hypothetical protein